MKSKLYAHLLLRKMGGVYENHYLFVIYYLFIFYKYIKQELQPRTTKENWATQHQATKPLD